MSGSLPRVEEVSLTRVEEVSLRGKRVLLRADLNVTFRPGTTEISDDSRIHASVPTIELLRRKGAKVVLCSHLGRPKGRVVPEMRIQPVRARMSEVLGIDVKYGGGPVGEDARNSVDGLDEGDVALLENLRFNPGEEANDAEFSQSLASLADVYVNDAFGASHRAHASILGVAEILPTYAGLLMRTEIEALDRALVSDERPSVALLGGAKVADKLGVIENLIPNVDAILIGGGMASAMLAAQGKGIGSTELNEEETSAARSLLADAEIAAKVCLPGDVVVAEEFDANSCYVEVDVDAIPNSGYVLDIGRKTVEEFVDIIASAKKVIWNGPMGLFEWKPFARGTEKVAAAIAANDDAFKLAGGGSTVEAINALGIGDQLTHVSTGGGASLEYLEGKTLPGIAALMQG